VCEEAGLAAVGFGVVSKDIIISSLRGYRPYLLSSQLAVVTSIESDDPILRLSAPH